MIASNFVSLIHAKISQVKQVKPILRLVDYSLSVQKETGSSMILNKVNFWVDEAEIVALVGPSGCGKTLTLSSILQLNYSRTFSQSGQIYYHTTTGEIELVNSKAISSIRREHIGYVFQQSKEVLNPSQRIGAQLIEKCKTDKETAINEVRGLLAELGLNPERFLKAYPHQISGGEMQRVLLAMALVNSPRLLLADEPFSNLDENRKTELKQLFLELRERKGLSILLVSHNQAFVDEVADRVVRMSAGKINYEADVSTIKDISESNPPRAKDSNAVLLSVKSLVKTYTSKPTLFGSTTSFGVLSECSFQIKKHEILGLVGPSGSGKSTLARIITQLDAPNSGDISFDGASIFALSKGEFSEYRSKVQMIFQDPLSCMASHRPVRHFIRDAFIAKEEKEDLSVVRSYFEKFQLSSDLLERLPAKLSGGQRQRIMIVRALIMGAELLICDEITASLDNAVANQVLDVLRLLNKEAGLSVLFISHDLAKAEALCHRIVTMEQINGAQKIGPEKVLSV